MVNMYGQTSLERACIQCIVENVKDIKEKWVKCRFTPEAEKQKAIDNWFEVDMSEWITKLEASLSEMSDSEEYAVGSKTSYADVMIWNLVEDTFVDPDHKVKALEAITKSSAKKLLKIANRVRSIKEVEDWLRDRPVTTM